MVSIFHETLRSSLLLNQPMNLIVNMSSLDLALVALMMFLFRFIRYRYESHPVASTTVESQPVEPRPQDPPPTPPFTMYVTPPSTPVKEHTKRNSADISSSETAVSHQVELEKRESSSSSRSFPLNRQAGQETKGAAPPSPPPSVTSNKSNRSTASTKSDAATGESINRRSTQEDSAFNSFKRLCDVHGLLKRPTGLGEQDVIDGINDEATLLRFFYAKQCDVSVAHKQFKEASLAREVNQLCSFYDDIDVHAYEETRYLYPIWVGRRDKKGQPICMFDFGKLDSKTMAAFKESSAKMEVKRSELKTQGIVSTEMLRAFTIFETLTRFYMPLCSAVPDRKYPDVAVTKTLCVVDISGIGLRQFWNMRGYIQDFAKLVGINYPEILDHVLVIGAPSYFPTVFGWIKKWVDPNTVKKLQILQPSEVLPTLQKYIDMEDIAQKYGGQFEYEHGMQPMLDPEVSKVLKWLPPNASLPVGPLKWIEQGKGKRFVVAVGNNEGMERREKVASLHRSHKSTV